MAKAQASFQILFRVVSRKPKQNGRKIAIWQARSLGLSKLPYRTPTRRPCVERPFHTATNAMIVTQTVCKKISRRHRERVFNTHTNTKTTGTTFAKLRVFQNAPPFQTGENGTARKNCSRSRTK